MAVLGTTTGDPQFYQRKVAALGDSIGGALSAFRERAEERRRREQAEIARFWQAASAEPELALTWGADLKKRSGANFPELAPMIDLLANRARLRQDIEGAGTAWMNAQGRMERDYRDKQDLLQQMPNVLTVPMPSFTPGLALLPVPNPEKMRAAEEVSRINPALLPLAALHELPPMDRARARAWAKSMPGMEGVIPDEYDPFGGDMPVELMPFEAERLWPGSVGEETLEIARYKAGKKLAPAEREKQEFQRGEREEKEEYETAEREAKEAEREAHLRLSHALQVARSERSFRQQSALEEQRAGNRRSEATGDKVSWQALADDRKAMQDGWDRQLKEKLAGLDPKDSGDGEEINRRTANHIKAVGPRPKFIPRAHLQIIASQVNKTEGLDVAAREALANQKMSAYLAAREVGKPQKDAVRSAKSWIDVAMEPESASPLIAAIAAVPPEKRAAVDAEVARQRKAKVPEDKIAAMIREAFGGGDE